MERVGFDHQTLGRNVLHQFAQMRATPLIAQPAGDADMPVLIQIVEQLFAAAGKAMHHPRAKLAVEVFQHRHEVGMRIALVQEQRFLRVTAICNCFSNALRCAGCGEKSRK